MDVQMLAIIMTIILSIGVFGNINIVIATVRKRHLKTKIHLLICAMAVMDTISIGFELSSAIRMLLHTEMMLRKTCFTFLWVYLVVYDTEMIVALFVAIDRLTAVLFPLRYKSTSAKVTIPLLLISSVMIGAVPVAAAAFYLQDDVLPVCNPPLVFPKSVFYYWNGATTFIACSIISIYICVFIAMHRLEKNQTNIRQLQITKTVASTIIAYACTKLVAVSTTFFLPIFSANEDFVDTVATYLVLLVAVEYGINYWLLLLRKDDAYRKPFLQQLGLGRFVTEQTWASETRMSRVSPHVQTVQIMLTR